MIISGKVNYKFTIVDDVKKAAKKALTIVKDVQQKTKSRVKQNLDGDVLNQKTGDLYRSVDGNSFVIEDGYNYTGQVGAFGMNIDFNYAGYWEGVISSKVMHDPYPRQFERPVFEDQSKEFLKRLRTIEF